jgi:hypothetical protein
MYNQDMTLYNYYYPAGSAVVAAVLEAELEISVTSAYKYVP